jgi:uncharacterized protein (TIGR00725 family)
MERKFKIGVMGSGEEESVAQKELAKLIGEAIAAQGCILITGSGRGLPHEAALAAAAKGGICLGFSPAMNLREHVEKYKFPIEPYILVFTGMEKKGRNLISIRSCDGVIFIGGRMGTLNEFTIAYDEADEKKVIGILEGSGGFSDKLFALAKESGKKSKAIIIREKDPIKLVNKMIQTLKEIQFDAYY